MIHQFDDSSEMTLADNGHLRAFLADRDEPCPLCGYNLRNLQTDHCPECGRQLRLTVGLTEPAIGAWISLLVATLLPAAFGLVLIAVFAASWIFASPGNRISLTGVPLPAIFVSSHILLAVPIAAAMLIWRRRFLKWRMFSQQMFMIAAWTMDALTVVCVIYAANH